jgi:glycosyltransferase involved in cell wall biosynthesis
MNNTASCFIAVSDAVKNQWINKGLNESIFIRIYDGVQLRNGVQNRKVDLKNKRNIKLVMTGSLQPAKGQEQAINMMAELKADGLSCTLDLIGDGSWPYTMKLKRIIRELELKTVRLLGYRNDVYEVLPNYDIGLMCSKDEAFGLVTAEYLMAGLPVLASDSGANREIVREGIDGYLYDHGNIQDMKEKLLKIIDENLGGVQSHQYAKREFSDVANAENIYNVYINILKDKTGDAAIL